MRRSALWLGLALMLLALASGARPAAADNCSSPGDCQETGGYNGIIAVVGGIAAVVAAAAAVAARSGGDDEPAGDDPGQPEQPMDQTDLAILQVSADRVEVDDTNDGQVTLTGWHAGPGGALERIDMPIRVDLPPDSGLTVDPTEGTGEVVVDIAVDENADATAEGAGGDQDEREVTLAASGSWNGQTVTQTITVVVRKRYDVVIVGAGLSGLVAARRLDTGLSVAVLEAGPRIGGRMLAQPLATAPGACVDLGGQWIGPTQTSFGALATELGLRRFDSYGEGATVFVWKGRRSTFEGAFPPFEGDPPDVSPEELADAKQAWAIIEAARVGPEPWTFPAAPAWDVLRLSDWLASTCTTDFGRFVVRVMARIGGSGAFEPEATSFLHMAFTQSVGGQAEHPEAELFHGCAGQVPRLIERAFSPKVRVVLGAPVQQIDQDPDKGATVVSQAGTFRAAEVIVAVPPSQAGRISYTGDPPLPPQRQGLTDRAPMGLIIKNHAIYETAWWRTADAARGRPVALSGTAVGDLDTVEFTADSSDPTGRPGILTSFIAGDRAAALAGADPATRRDLVLADYVRFFGEEARNPMEYVEKNWPVEPWIEGAFTAYLTPGAWTRYGPALRPPFGRVHWAGTEAAPRWPGYFDGAVRAGEDAAAAARAALPQRRH